MSNLDKAIEIACKAHAGQTDKADQPYILHPLRLMLMFQNEQERIVAVLHDVIEDSDLTQDDLITSGFSKTIVNALDCLTKRDNENYEDFINRVLPNELARKVKIEDIKDNLNLTRIKSLGTKDLDRVMRYHEALKKLKNS